MSYRTSEMLNDDGALLCLALLCIAVLYCLSVGAGVGEHRAGWQAADDGVSAGLVRG